MKKQECDLHCKVLYPDSIILWCRDCLKKIEYKLTIKQSTVIAALMACDDDFEFKQ